MSYTPQKHVAKMYADVGRALTIAGRTIVERQVNTQIYMDDSLVLALKFRLACVAPEIHVSGSITPYRDSSWLISFIWNTGPGQCAYPSYYLEDPDFLLAPEAFAVKVADWIIAKKRDQYDRYSAA